MLFGIVVSFPIRVVRSIEIPPNADVVLRTGSSRGRGTRAAGWFADYITEQRDESMQSLVLEGGIKGWATAGPEYTALMVEYNADVWKNHSS